MQGVWCVRLRLLCWDCGTVQEKDLTQMEHDIRTQRLLASVVGH